MTKSGDVVYRVIDEWDDGLDPDRRELTTTTFEEALKALQSLDFRLPNLIDAANQIAGGPDLWAWERKDGILIRRASIKRETHEHE